jgi:hypothetical protein
MGDIAEQLIEQEMFGYDDAYSYKPRGNKKPKGKFRKTASIHLTPSERKIASIRKEIAIMISVDGIPVQEARRLTNIKYGNGWRERTENGVDGDRWSDEDLIGFR